MAAVRVEAADRTPRPLCRPPAAPSAQQAAPPAAYPTAVARQRTAIRRYPTADSLPGAGGQRGRREIKSDLNKTENEKIKSDLKRRLCVNQSAPPSLAAWRMCGGAGWGGAEGWGGQYRRQSGTARTMALLRGEDSAVGVRPLSATLGSCRAAPRRLWAPQRGPGRGSRCGQPGVRGSGAGLGASVTEFLPVVVVTAPAERCWKLRQLLKRFAWMFRCRCAELGWLWVLVVASLCVFSSRHAALPTPIFPLRFS